MSKWGTKVGLWRVEREFEGVAGDEDGEKFQADGHV